MTDTTIRETRITLPAYPEGKTEELPMFAENRVHQRTSGNPYPNKVVMSVDRSRKEDKEYTLVTLENEYLRVDILPEIGGRIYAALDKKTGYDFFYKQHVIKPALIGVLGSWISGGVEFNWPFHHRASGFMPCDHAVETLPDGGVACHLSEHDPTDRMKGMVSVILRPGEKRFETRMRLFNRTPEERSFLWWENAAVPVNKDYRLFFPPDVTYVNFHYLKSRTGFPIAPEGVYNGIPMKGETDVSYHRNTVPATSYFACASEYDFFGGYDEGRRCGVVHIGDRHVTPGKKMFTWGYGQLAKSWENALTDDDGQYAELMAGSYSDNQPNFSWLAPYETKEFSQSWYPISEIGVPTYANLDCAFSLDKESRLFRLQTTKTYEDLAVEITDGNAVWKEKRAKLAPDEVFCAQLPAFAGHVTVTVSADGKTLARYAEKDADHLQMPETASELPFAAETESADELYLAGVHVDQYRDPATRPDAYWQEALRRAPRHVPSLIAMAKYALRLYRPDEALDYCRKAVGALTVFNERPQSGEAYYTMGRILEAKGDTDGAYDRYYKAFWAADCAAKAMTRIALIDVLRKEYEKAVRHAETALDYGRKNNLAIACLILAGKELGEDTAGLVDDQLKQDPLDHLTRFVSGADDLYGLMHSDPVQTCLDMAFDLAAMGRYADIARLLAGLEQARPDCRTKPLYYALGFFTKQCGGDGKAFYEKAKGAPLGKRYPSRFEEIAVLTDVIRETGDGEAKMLLGCLYYHKRHCAEAVKLWEDCGNDVTSMRNRAVAYFSRLNRADEALGLMKEALAAKPDDEQLLYETVVLMDKMSVDPREKIGLMLSHRFRRDDVFTELAKAYNQAFEPDKAIETMMSHAFVPCEGGEHAIADQYMFAYLVKGVTALQNGGARTALGFFREGQTLLQSLGAGIWNRCKLVPLKYHEALCLEALGNGAEADDIFKEIADIEIEYFSNMYLKELPYYQAKALVHLQKPAKARQVMTGAKREWERITDRRDDGFFSTTPFFISFIDDPAKLRKAQGLYLVALCDAFEGKTADAKAKIAESARLNGGNLFARLFERFGFLR